MIAHVSEYCQPILANAATEKGPTRPPPSAGCAILPIVDGLFGPARANPIRRLQLALLSIVLLVFIGTMGFMFLGPAEPLDALLMTVVTISTVGYQEEVALDTPAIKVFTIVLIISAVLVVASAVRSVAALVFADYFWTHVGRQRMQSRIDQLAGHVIVCGYGRMGRHVTAELKAEGRRVVIVEPDAERVDGIVAGGQPGGIGGRHAGRHVAAGRRGSGSSAHCGCQQRCGERAHRPQCPPSQRQPDGRRTGRLP